MKLLFPTAVMAAVLPSLVAAQAEMDANMDGFVSFDELVDVYPNVSTELFLSLDTDGDALLNENELVQAQMAGLLTLEEE